MELLLGIILSSRFDTLASVYTTRSVFGRDVK